MHQVGYIAASCFIIFTVVGAVAQVLKLAKRTRAWRQKELDQDRVCDGLHPVREMWSYSAFLLFALSGLTRSYIDYFLLLSRFPVVMLSTVILWFLQFHGQRGAKRFFRLAILGDGILILLILLVTFRYRFHGTLVPWVVDGALIAVSILLFYGKQLQAFTMYRERRSKAVSWTREIGLVLKDFTGFWYSALVGRELVWVSVTHVLSAISSITICSVKYYSERKHKENI